MKTNRLLVTLSLLFVVACADAALAQGPAATPSEVETLRGEIERLRDVVERQQKALEALERRLEGLPAAPPAPAAPAAATAAAPAPARQSPSPDDALRARVEELQKRWGGLRLSGDVQLRYEGFYDQGFDAPAEQLPRNRFRARVRAQLTGEIAKNFDWGIRLASGSFDNPISTQQTLTDYYTRKPIAIDRAYLRYDSKTKPVRFEVVGGKFDAPWRHTGVTFDEDVQPEGFAETLRFDVGERTPLRGLSFVAWQLPYRERSVGADAVLFGGQLATDWRLSEDWSLALSGTFHDFEQVDVIPPATNVSPTLVNAGFDYGTTNAVVVNPFTGLPEYRSEYRVVDAIAELRYAGFGPRTNGSSRWPLVFRADWVHNTSAYNNQRDGGQLEAIVGRRQEAGDWQFDYGFWKVEREAFPSVFMDSEMIIQTNSLTHSVRGRYQLVRNVELIGRYFRTRRLETTSPVNRWLNHLQIDVQYRF